MLTLADKEEVQTVALPSGSGGRMLGDCEAAEEHYMKVAASD